YIVDGAMMRSCRILILTIAALLVALPALAAGDGVELAAFPPIGRLDYTVMREGSKVGTHTVEFARDGNRLTVTTNINIAVKMLGITIFRFEHHAEELWESGQLTRVTSRTDDDGEKRVVDLRREGDRLRGSYNGFAKDLPATLIPSSMWHPDSMKQTALLDPIKGRERQVQIADKGEETVTVKGRDVTAHHYAVTGQIKRELWYGPDGQIAQARFPAGDGSLIALVLR
ncbi:MAG: DUF6134 family protein, partial [Dongiaceae bacterium]